MYPYIHLGPLTIPTFGLMLWLAAVCAGFALHRNFRRFRIQADAVSIVAFVTVLGVFGAFLWNRLQHPAEYVEFLRVQFATLQMHLHSSNGGSWHRTGVFLEDLVGFLPRDGFAWYGGLIAGILTLMWQGRAAKVGELGMLDLAAPAAAVGYGVGRIGCLTSGDGDYGINTTLPWGVHMAKNALQPPTPPDALVQPTPIYELLFSLLVFWILWRLAQKHKPVGWLTGAYLVLAGVGRFLVEFIRINPRIYLGMSNAQVASIGSIVVGIALIVWARRHAAVRTERAAAAT
jgi:phosphatidylglycerol---prolipoprotein diacylglyceryl transferase